ncbi:lysine-specific demethylase 4C isoform X1 [Xenopus tropicalis]|uniref:[histone H3]-trimethyl-L-lysine(9) demethylase n=1 Tax=Xenopus tropicalis TaxID=8364 RepID=A0A8J0S9K3_XENTR|nr:lysine-specific demethylase 4C isoform X1 [Xenopus tropicalis]|eukprot:XP_012808166.1 PREDICTED: lysine-specific demethylase 4C isoform X1 [Xenopus tropicalis]
MASADSDEQNPTCKIMTFRPTFEEFKDFNKYLVYMESKGAHRAGLAKVIPPKEWKPKRHYDDIDDLVIPAPIQQMVTGQSGLFTQYNIQKKPMTVKEFRHMANSGRYCTPTYIDYEDLERKYWKNVTFVPPIYGADVNGSLYEKGVEEWNISRLKTILDVVEEECGISIEGVNTPYLYFGMWKTTFAWHTEDMDLYSINYLHFGEPKSWYTVPPEHGKRLERLAQGFFPSSFQGCDAFLRHKMTLISPSILKKYGIPFSKITQEPGEFMITFPYGYHAGFNHGFNCAESTNFATVRWIDYGKIAKLCSCSNDMVKISMDIFVKIFQKSRYQLWKQGKDICTIDHTKPTTGPTPEVIAWNMKRSRRKKGALKSLQHTRSRSKKLKTPEDKKTVVAGAEILATEATDDFKVNNKPTVKVELEDKEKPSGCMEIIKEENVNQSGSNIIQASAGSGSSLKEEEVHQEQHGDTKLNLASSGSEELPGTFATSAVQEGRHTEHETEKNALYPNSQDYHPSELESTEKDDTISNSSEEDTSDLDIAENGLEPGEIPNMINDEKQVSEISSQCATHLGEKSGKQKQTTKSRRLPLSNPPCGSSMMVIKEDVSDGELSESPCMDNDVAETELWAKPLFYLWQTKSQSFAAEKAYNESVSGRKPHCAICTLFLPYNKSETYNDEIQAHWDDLSNGIISSHSETQCLIPEMCFKSRKGKKQHSPPKNLIKEDDRSLLVTCAKCCVQVHSSCYGVPSHEIHDGWMCARCRIGVWTAECCLCNLRGGALKQTTDDKWAHVMCAIAVPEVKFQNVTERSEIDTSMIPLERLKLRCVFCRERVNRVSGACIQCSYGRCPTSFHVTCAHAAGVLMEPDDWPFVVYTTCFRHMINQNMRSKIAKKEITIGQTVIAKHRNTRYYNCQLKEITSQTFYEIVFDDGSTSKDTFPEDIVNRDCVKLGPPAEGDTVEVKWSDGLLYGGKYLGKNIVYMYQVEFEDGSQIVTKREDIYTLDEELPKKIRSRYSRASDMKFEDEFYGEEVICGQKKRQRVLNVKLENDYVNDPLYHTFLKSSFQATYQQVL